jgi:hypothetical protein
MKSLQEKLNAVAEELNPILWDLLDEVNSSGCYCKVNSVCAECTKNYY